MDCGQLIAVKKVKHRMLFSKFGLVDIKAVGIRCGLYMHRVVKRTGIKRTQKTFNAFYTIMRGQVHGGLLWLPITIVHDLHYTCKVFGVFFLSRHRSI